MKINVPQVDWFTFTTYKETIFSAWKIWQSSQVGDSKAGKIRMYDGEWRGNSFVGEGLQGSRSHGLIKVSGSDSHKAFYELVRSENAKCTRIDLQVTTPLPFGYSARQFADDVRAGQSDLYERSIKLIENSDGFDTVYIGSGSSDRFARFYVKLVDDQLYLRFEVEYKSNWAVLVAQNIKDDEKQISAVLLDFLNSMAMQDSQGVIQLFTDLLDYEKANLKLGHEVRDINKTMEWILEQVTPAMVRLLLDHDQGSILADHLTGLVEKFYKSD